LRAVAGKVLIMEAFMVRFHPQWLRVRDLIRQGQVGTLRVVQMLFTYFNDDPVNIRNMAAIGGGAVRHRLLSDRGGPLFFEAEPKRAMPDGSRSRSAPTA
jgi:hypothetical protein